LENFYLKDKIDNKYDIKKENILYIVIDLKKLLFKRKN